LSPDGLRESWLSARTANTTAIATWKKIAKRLKSMTVQGATAINPDTKTTGPAKGHRFSEGARTLEAAGVPMLTITGIIMKPALAATGVDRGRWASGPLLDLLI